MNGGDWPILRNAVRQATAGLTAVEIDTEAHARDCIAELARDLAGRPHAIVTMACHGTAAPLQEAQNLTRDWPPEQGVLFLIDQTPLPEEPPLDAAQPPPEEVAFWREMNLQREAWGALGCHVVFFLLPGNYRLLLLVADHLADWIPLKLHLLGAEDARTAKFHSQHLVVPSGRVERTPQVAREQLDLLEQHLAGALSAGNPDRGTLARRFYLPMLEAALDAGDLGRARTLRAHIREADVPEADRVPWWRLNVELDFWLRNLADAQQWALKLLEEARDAGNPSLEADACVALGSAAIDRGDLEEAEKWHRQTLAIAERTGRVAARAAAFHQLGRIAQERGQFDEAENWYRQSLTMQEQLADERGQTATRHQLGRVAEERRRFNEAERWYRQSLAIEERLGNERGQAVTLHQLGNLAYVRRQFDQAESWYRQSLAIEEQLGDERGQAITLHQLGTLAQDRGDVAEAERFFQRTVALAERLGDPHNLGAARRSLARVRNAGSEN